MINKLLRTTAFILISLHLLASLVQAATPSETITDLKTFRELGDQAVDRKVDLEATVTFAEPIWSHLFVQEGSDAVFIDAVNARGFNLGDRVRIVGTGQRGDTSPLIRADKVSRLHAGTPPDPIALKTTEMNSAEHDCRYISIEGVVEKAVNSMGHTLYFCESNGVQFHVSMLGNKSLNELWNLIGTTYQFEGALGVTLEAGSELKDLKLGPRKIERLRLSCTKEPVVVSPSKRPPLPSAQNPTATSDTFLLEGQVTAKFRNSFIVADNDNARRIQFPGVHGIGHANIVRVAGTRTEQGQLVASSIESLFSTRLPIPVEFHKIQPSRRECRYVKVLGRPENVRTEGSHVHFKISREGQTANVKLERTKFASHNLLENTQLLEVTGAVVNCDPDGNCDVIVSDSSHISFVEPIVPTSRYVVWILLPLSLLFLTGFIWVKRQRNRAAAQAESINAMHAQLVSTCGAISDGLLALDNDERVITVNAEFNSLVGRDFELGEQLTTATCEQFLSRVKNHEAVRKLISISLLTDTDDNRITVEITSPEPRTFELCVSRIIADDGTGIGRLMLMRDRTCETQLQAELIRSNKIEAVGQLVGGIAHDFNNILTTITANLSLINLESGLDNRVLGQVTDAAVAANRGTDLVRRMLTYSGKAELNPQPQSINKIVRELHKFAKATFDARYRFHFDLEDDEPYVFVDSGAIEQVILNLYLNARDAMPDGGSITTKTFLTTEGDEPTVCIWVTDNGPGVDDSIREQIFEPFFTTKAAQAGTGLGLSTSRRLILEQNGLLLCDSNMETGTRFVVTLPTTQSVEVPRVDEPVELPQVCNKKTILVVDDEDSIRKIACLILDRYGFDVLTAVNGEAALAVLSTEHQRIDMVLLDLTMPGMSGLDVLEVANVVYPEIPVVICSGYLASVAGELGDGCLKLPKPFSAEKLISTVSKALKLEPSSVEPMKTPLVSSQSN